MVDLRIRKAQTANRGAQPNNAEMEMTMAQSIPVLHYGLDFTASAARSRDAAFICL